MAQVDGLGALQVRVARHAPVAVRLGELEQPRHQVGDQLGRARRAPADEERQVGRHLVVARAPGVQLAADRAGELGQPALDRHVDVLVGVAELELPALELRGDRVEAGQQRVALVAVEDAAARCRPPTCAREPSMSSGQRRTVEADRRVQAREQRVLGLEKRGMAP